MSVARFIMPTLIRQKPSQECRKTDKTLAEGITAELPIRGQMILEAISATNGAFTTVEDTDIKTGLATLAAKGIYVEPTSAVVVKAYQKFLQAGIITSGDQVVSILTGIGLKSEFLNIGFLRRFRKRSMQQRRMRLLRRGTPKLQTPPHRTVRKVMGFCADSENAACNNGACDSTERHSEITDPTSPNRKES